MSLWSVLNYKEAYTNAALKKSGLTLNISITDKLKMYKFNLKQVCVNDLAQLSEVHTYRTLANATTNATKGAVCKSISVIK